MPAEPDREDILADLGDRFRAERRARALSQQDVAARAGIGLQRVKSLEVGQATLSAYVAVCRALGLALDHMLSDRWEMPEQQPRLTARQVQVLQAIQGDEPLSVVARRLETTRQVVGARLSEVYRLLGLSGVPVGERRRAALRVAEQRGLLTTQSSRHAA